MPMALWWNIGQFVGNTCFTFGLFHRNPLNLRHKVLVPFIQGGDGFCLRFQCLHGRIRLQTPTGPKTCCR
jgi:hypothetical protein